MVVSRGDYRQPLIVTKDNATRIKLQRPPSPGFKATRIKPRVMVTIWRRLNSECLPSGIRGVLQFGQAPVIPAARTSREFPASLWLVLFSRLQALHWPGEGCCARPGLSRLRDVCLSTPWFISDSRRDMKAEGSTSRCVVGK